jgi:hypothetical protein
VTVNGDVLDEPDETFVVNLSNAVNATIGDAQGTGTITDDDGAPTLSINDVEVTEGNSGTVNAVFAVTLSPTSAQAVTVSYATADGSATTADNDYVAASDTVTFQPGASSRPVTVTVNGDVLEEPDETFVVNLSNAVNATIGDPQGTGTINNDDGVQPPVTVSFQDGVSGYTGTRDTKLISASPTINFGTDGKLELDGSPDQSSLLSWNVTGIPSGSTVQSVDISVNITNGSGDTYEFYQMLRPWVETQATWNVYATAQSWQTAGADGSADRGSTVLGSITGAKGPATISLNPAGVAVVQGWVNNPVSNFGFVISDYVTASNGLDLSSREAGTVANRPKLTVTYSAGAGPSGSTTAFLAKLPGSEASEVILPESLVLSANYPNPFNIETRIEYTLPKDASVRLTIHNIRGQQVRLLVNENQSAGYKIIRWNGLDEFGQEVGTGIYFIQLVVDHERLFGKLTLQK